MGLRRYGGKLAVRQPGEVRAGSLAILDLEYDASRQTAGHLDGDAAARLGTSIGANVAVSGNRIRTTQTVVFVVNPEGHANVDGDDRGRSLIPVLHDEQAEVGVFVWQLQEAFAIRHCLGRPAGDIVDGATGAIVEAEGGHAHGWQ